MTPHKALHVLTWHVHGNYLYYLSQVPHVFVLPVDRVRSPGYCGRSGRLPWGPNVIEVPLEELRHQRLDCVLYQSVRAWEHDRHAYLSEAQRRLPAIYLEHDPPPRDPTDTPHPVDDPRTLLVHVTAFNRLMWHSRRTPSTVVEHGVLLPQPAEYSGVLPRGIVVVNHLAQRGRRVGADLYASCRREVPLDLVGMEATRAGGLGEIGNLDLPAFMAQYRFYFHPIRWTSLGLAVIEAMMVGLPIVGLATTELVTVIENGRSGYLDTEPQRLCEAMRRLIADSREAQALGARAKAYAQERFGIGRFVQDWLSVFRRVAA